MSLRLESKWSATSRNLTEITDLLLQEDYHVLYPARRIYSVYYDGIMMPEYWRGEEGIVPRKKHRIRWYHRMDGYRNGANYEVKITGVDGRLKFSSPVGSDPASHHPEVAEMRKLIYARRILPLSLVTYVRRYFGHDSGRRFTVDHDLTYHRVLTFDRHGLKTGFVARDEHLAFELKAPYETDDQNFAESVPMMRVRFSKFARSLERLAIV